MLQWFEIYVFHLEFSLAVAAVIVVDIYVVVGVVVAAVVFVVVLVRWWNTKQLIWRFWVQLCVGAAQELILKASGRAGRLWVLGDCGVWVIVGSGWLWVLGDCGVWVIVGSGWLLGLGDCGFWVIVGSGWLCVLGDCLKSCKHDFSLVFSAASDHLWQICQITSALYNKGLQWSKQNNN